MIDRPTRGPDRLIDPKTEILIDKAVNGGMRISALARELEISERRIRAYCDEVGLTFTRQCASSKMRGRNCESARLRIRTEFSALPNGERSIFCDACTGRARRAALARQANRESRTAAQAQPLPPPK